MKCHVCGGGLKAIVTDMPFMLSQTTIIILKELPVSQCENCGEFLTEDPIMERAETIFENVDEATEVEIVRFAA